MDRYEKAALELVPLGRRPSIVHLRKTIAAMLATEITAALRTQQEAHFPEVAILKTTLDRRKTELAACERALAEREQRVVAQEQRLANFLTAFGSYAAWLEGDGELDENERRFDTLRTACQDFKKEHYEVLAMVERLVPDL